MEIIKCHGSGNDFIMVDTTCDDTLRDIDWCSFARAACDRSTGVGSDGILLVIKHEDGIYGMDMLNPDGTHAEMCGNGIRCVARLASERGYLTSGILRSGERDYPCAMASEIYEGIATFAVDIPISLWSKSFAHFHPEESFIGKVIEELHPELKFTALNLGNPHIVAHVEKIDLSLLEELGERVKVLTHIFPEGVNVSLYERHSARSIFVATYERGAGITLSCGTAMTASATAATLLGLTTSNTRIEVRNRGGMVHCQTSISKEGITTRLEGNATFEWRGEATFDSGILSYRKLQNSGEAERWERFVQSINKE